MSLAGPHNNNFPLLMSSVSTQRRGRKFAETKLEFLFRPAREKVLLGVFGVKTDFDCVPLVAEESNNTVSEAS